MKTSYLIWIHYREMFNLIVGENGKHGLLLHRKAIQWELFTVLYLKSESVDNSINWTSRPPRARTHAHASIWGAVGCVACKTWLSHRQETPPCSVRPEVVHLLSHEHESKRHGCDTINLSTNSSFFFCNNKNRKPSKQIEVSCDPDSQLMYRWQTKQFVQLHSFVTGSE